MTIFVYLTLNCDTGQHSQLLRCLDQSMNLRFSCHSLFWEDDNNRVIHFTPIQFGLGIPANIFYVTATIVKHRKHRLRQAVRIAYEEQQLDAE